MLQEIRQISSIYAVELKKISAYSSVRDFVFMLVAPRLGYTVRLYDPQGIICTGVLTVEMQEQRMREKQWRSIDLLRDLYRSLLLAIHLFSVFLQVHTTTFLLTNLIVIGLSCI